MGQGMGDVASVFFCQPAGGESIKSKKCVQCGDAVLARLDNGSGGIAMGERFSEPIAMPE